MLICDKQMILVGLKSTKLNFQIIILLQRFVLDDELPGQGDMKQSWTSSDIPIQLAPPCAGEGLSHDLFRSAVPLAHVTEQLDHVPHADQSPLTTTNQQHMYST